MPHTCFDTRCHAALGRRCGSAAYSAASGPQFHCDDHNLRPGERAKPTPSAHPATSDVRAFPSIVTWLSFARSCMASTEDIRDPLPGLTLTSGNVADRKLPVALALLSSLADNEMNLWLLLRQLKTRVGVVPFVGAGMSVPFGFPAWRPFLESQAPEATVRQHVVNLLDQGLYEEAAETLLKAQGESAFQAALEHAFGEHQLPNPLPAAAILPSFVEKNVP